jgi:hypothetical protein
MKVRSSRGALVLDEPGSEPAVRSLVSPVNDLIGLRADHEYAVHLMQDYWPLWPANWFRPDPAEEGRADLGYVLEQVGHQLSIWKQQRLPSLFLGAAQRAEQGHLSAKLGRHLERVTRRPGDEPDEIPDGELATLATWALDEALRLRPLVLRECPLCKVPWITDPGQPSPYCSRPYPGRLMSCREMKKDEHFRENQRDWRLEYKRIYERKNRGTVTEEDWEAWRAENGPNGWIAFDEWKQRRDVLASIPILPTRPQDATPTAP